MSLHSPTAHGREMEEAADQRAMGFWLYLMTDCILFATAFAGYAVLYRNVATGPMGREIFDLPYVMVETAALLLSSITYGFAMIAGYKGNKKATLAWLALTFAFGATFIGMSACANGFQISCTNSSTSVCETDSQWRSTSSSTDSALAGGVVCFSRLARCRFKVRRKAGMDRGEKREVRAVAGSAGFPARQIAESRED